MSTASCASPTSSVSPQEAAAAPSGPTRQRHDRKPVQQPNHRQQARQLDLQRDQPQPCTAALGDDPPAVAAPIPRTQGCTLSSSSSHSMGSSRRLAGAEAEERLQQGLPGRLRPENEQQRQHALQQAGREDGSLATEAACFSEDSLPASPAVAAGIAAQACTATATAASRGPRGHAGSEVARERLRPRQQLPNHAGPSPPVAGQPMVEGNFPPQGHHEKSNGGDGMAGPAYVQKNYLPIRRDYVEEPCNSQPGERSQRGITGLARSQRSLLGQLLRAIVALALLILRQVQEVAVVCLWQMVHAILGVLRQVCCRCSIGLHAAAAGLVGRVRSGRGRMAIALDAFASLLQRLGLLLKRGAATASAAESMAASEALAARVAAVGTAAAVGSKWKAMTSGLQKAARSASTAEDLRMPEEFAHADGSLELTHEEALATGEGQTRPGSTTKGSQ